MNLKLNKNQLARFSRQIILKNIGTLGQKKIIQSKILIIGMGGLGCPVAEFLARAGIIGTLQANEILKKILNIGKSLNGYILILDLLNLNFRKVKLNKIKNV